MQTSSELNPAALLSPFRIIPVVVIDDANDAVPLAQALLAGGVGVIELTLRTPAALDAASRIARQVPQMCLGLGTVLDAPQVASCKSAGAQFLVSPGWNASVDAAVREAKIAWLPGAVTSSEVMQRRAEGFRMLKLFPAQTVGGVALLKGYAEVFADLKFCPTGGISQVTAPDYLALPNVPCLGGSWLAPRALVQARKWADITALAAASCAI
jgi:2-dehydro-3-deoxyphosphogluconate aldolase / (4S)-4-hydroxy-2-oxoglutarate aldolase